MRKILFYLLIVLLVIISYFLGKDRNSSPEKSTSNVDNGKYECNRTERYKNLPEFDRALSLIDQRFSLSQMDTMGFAGEDVKEKDYWHNLTSCIVVEYSDIKDQKGAEGYFLFDDKKVKPNYLPVYVNRSYSQVDDVTLALLLVHEMTHAAQYLYTLNGAAKFNCYNAETAAFASQWNFFNRLNNEERKNIGARLITNPDHPQLELIGSMIESYVAHKKECGTDENCAYNKVVDGLEQMIRNSPFYQKECSSPTN